MKILSSIILATTSLFLMACASTGVTAAPGGVKPWPKDTCVVTGNKLGSMGPVITQVHEGQEVKFCCKPCVKKFNSNPGKYLALLPKS